MTSSLEEKVGELLKARRLTLAVAESCTGGLVGHRLTNVPGSSAYFLGGVIAYSNEVKERLLGVSHATLTDFGAVSEETAREMARGACRVLGTDIGVAVTGIAGPGGGVPGHRTKAVVAIPGRSGQTPIWIPSSKPVGLTWIALAAAGASLSPARQRPSSEGGDAHHDGAFAAKNFERAERCLWDSDRITNKEKSAEAALRLVKEYLESLR